MLLCAFFHMPVFNNLAKFFPLDCLKVCVALFLFWCSAKQRYKSKEKQTPIKH